MQCELAATELEGDGRARSLDDTTASRSQQRFDPGPRDGPADGIREDPLQRPAMRAVHRSMIALRASRAIMPRVGRRSASRACACFAGASFRALEAQLSRHRGRHVLPQRTGCPPHVDEAGKCRHVGRRVAVRDMSRHHVAAGRGRNLQVDPRQDRRHPQAARAHSRARARGCPGSTRANGWTRSSSSRPAASAVWWSTERQRARKTQNENRTPTVQRVILPYS